MLRYRSVPDISSDKVEKKGVNTTFEMTLFKGHYPVFDKDCELWELCFDQISKLVIV
jgi:hypothetical protein